MTKQQLGFTLVELMIATTVFATVLLLCTYGLLAIGRTYYKGLAVSRTQENARVILDDVGEALQFSSGNVVLTPPGGSETWHCIGQKRYSFAYAQDPQPNKHGLVSDTVHSCTGAVASQALDNTAALTDTSREMLSPRMKLLRFEIERLAGTDRLYKVTVAIGIGYVGNIAVDITDMDFVVTPDGVQCSNERHISTFCTVTELSTTVQRRV